MTTSYAPAEYRTPEHDPRPGADNPDGMSRRRYDLDWLRICAFGVLILYHVGLLYVTWDASIKSRYISTVLEPAMGLISSLASLFFISGVAVRFAIDKVALGKFLVERTKRLFIPLAFGTLVVCVPQSYVALRYSGEIPPGFFAFYRDYLGFGQYAFSLPDLHQLWYVAAILSYTLITAACLPVMRAVTSKVSDPLFGWLAGGRAWRMLFVLAIPFVLYVAVLDIYSFHRRSSAVGPARRVHSPSSSSDFLRQRTRISGARSTMRCPR